MRPALAFISSVVFATSPIMLLALLGSGRFAFDPGVLSFGLLLWAMDIVVVAVLTVVPFAICCYLASRYSLSSVLFWAIGGALSGLAPCIAAASWAAASLPVGDPDRLGFLPAMLRFTPGGVLLGFMAGALYWLLSIRRKHPIRVRTLA